MQVNDEYDLIVIGNQLAGYFLATAAAQEGMRVLVIEAKPRLSAVFERPTGNFLTDMHWEPFIGLETGDPEDGFLQRLGLYQDVDELFPKMNPSLQMISPSGRVDISYPIHSMQNEWEREFPRSSDSLCQLGARIQAGAGSGSRSFGSMVEQLGLEAHWSQIGDIQAPLYGAVSPDDIRVGLVREYMSNATKSVRYSIGGRDSMKEILVSRLKWFGGRVKRDAWVEEIVFEKGSLAGVLLSSFEGFVRSRMVVGNTSSRKFLELLPPESRPDALERVVKAMNPRYWRFNFTVQIPEAVVPEGMGNHVCYHESDADLDEGQFLQVFVLPRGSYSGVLPGKRILLVRTLLPIMSKAIQPEYLSVTMKRAMRRLETFIPFISESDMTIVPDPKNIHSDRVFHSYFNFDTVDDIPHDLLVYGSTADETCSLGVQSDWSQFGVGGLALCSRDVRPALGLMGEIRTAMEVLQNTVMK